MRAFLFLVVVVLAAACGGGSSSSPAECVSPNGVWDLELRSSECGDQSLPSTLVSDNEASDGCSLVSSDFDPKSCTLLQVAKCEGYTGTVVYTVNAAGTLLEGTTTFETDDGTVCDYETTGTK